MKHKIIQISAMENGHREVLFALTEQGNTFYGCLGDGGKFKWQQLPDIPETCPTYEFPQRRMP